MRLVGYTRVSTEKQESEGLSLQAQAHKIKSYCELHDHELVALLAEAQSAKDTNRPQFQHAISMIDDDMCDAVVVVKIDRLSRNVRDMAQLIEDRKLAGKIISITDKIDLTTAQGKFFTHILIALSQLEREQTGERVRDALGEAKRQGARLGRTPYGYKRLEERDESGRRIIVEHPKEQGVIYAIFNLKSQGYTFRDIAEFLNTKEVPTRRGKPWAHQSVQTIYNRVLGERQAPPTIAPHEVTI